MPKGYARSLENAVRDALAGTFRPVNTYPAYNDFNNDGKLEDNEKGTLICLNRKVLQKFCNNREGASWTSR